MFLLHQSVSLSSVDGGQAGVNVAPVVDKAQPHLLLDRVSAHPVVDIHILVGLFVECRPGDRNLRLTFVRVSVDEGVERENI